MTSDWKLEAGISKLGPIDLPDYVLTNRAHWDRHADWWVGPGERHWQSEPTWGLWAIPEAELCLLPSDMTGMRAIELGCGTGYVSAWMARRGASCVGIDNSERQLATARRLADEHGVPLELIHGNAEEVPYDDGTFDFAISEYGVAIWADPYKWIPEAHRVLKSGARLVFLGNHPLTMLVQDFSSDDPATRTLMRPYFGMHRVDWDDGEDHGVEFNLTISDWISLFADTGFEIVGYHELRSPEPGEEVRFYASKDWAHDYPSEQVWDLRKR